MDDLKRRLNRLGLLRYYDILVGEGFEEWETVLDITEADLDALNINLSHRRILQRAIEESRNEFSGYVSAHSTSASSDTSNNENLYGKNLNELAAVRTYAGVKRKYRRHPKPDSNAPARPVSAYVLFRNQTRKQFDIQPLSFAEKAKVEGQQWRALSEEERSEYRRQARALKEKYTAELVEYQKTLQYAEYQDYLRTFEAKYGQDRGSTGVFPRYINPATKSPQGLLISISNQRVLV